MEDQSVAVEVILSGILLCLAPGPKSSVMLSSDHDGDMGKKARDGQWWVQVLRMFEDRKEGSSGPLMVSTIA